MQTRNRTTVKDRLALAKANGFVPRAVLPKATERTISSYTSQRHQEVLIEWKQYLEVCGLPETEKPTQDLCKNFIHFYITSRKGRIADNVAQSSVISFWKYLVGALGLDKEIVSEGYKYIRNDLDLSREARIRHIVSNRDIDNLLRQLWVNDASEYLCPRTRIHIALWLCLQSASGQRGGTFSESTCYKDSNESLWYKDTLLYLEKVSDGREVLHLKVGMRFRKGARQSARSFNFEDIPSIVFYEHNDPVRNIIAYFISLALADNAFKAVRTIDDIVKAKIPPGQDIWVFDWKESIGEMPVFQELNENGPTGKSMTYASVKGHIVNLGRRAGYSENITMHAIRRAFLNSVNANYSTARRNQIAGHSGNMFEESYQSSVSSVDGYAMMVGRVPNADHASTLQSMALFRCHNAPTRLPVRIKDEMLDEEEYREMVDRLETIAKLLRKDRDDLTIKNERSLIYSRKSCYERKKLQEYQKTWADRQQFQSIDHEPDAHSEVVHRASDFSILRSFMPERNRLADSLFTPSYVRDAEGQQTLQDLLYLASTKYSETMYRPGEEPVDGKCPFNGCGRSIDEIHKFRRADHIHYCHKRELIKQQIQVSDSRSSRRVAFTDFCYHCNKWVLNVEDWIEDCKQHLIDPPIYCNVFTYRNVMIRPGLCPFCLADEDMRVPLRFKTFERKNKLIEHLQGHLQLLEEDSKLFCPHPKCRHNVKEETLMDHFEHIHAIAPVGRIETTKRKRKEGASPGEMNLPKKKKASRKTNNSSKSRNKHIDSSSLDDQLEEPKHNNVPPLNDQFEDLEHSNGSSPDDRFEDFNQENLFVNGWETEWDNILDPWATSYYDGDITNIDPDLWLKC